MAQTTVDFRIHEQNEHLQEEMTTEIPFLEEKPSLKELNQDIFSNDKAIKIDNNSKVKARNFLTNVSYNRIATADFNNGNFVIDCFTFMIVYLNPFYLERKFESLIEREFVNVLWAYLMPETLYQFINSDQNIKILNKIKIKHQDGKNIISEFLKKDANNLIVLSGFLQKNAILYQYLFSNLFPKCFSRVNDYGISAKTLFNKYYHNFHLQRNMLDFVKEQQEIKEENDSPINMTTLFDVQNDDENNEIVDQNSENKNTENKENIRPKTKNKKAKRKTAEEKKQIREAKKRKLLEQLNENTEKMLQIKGKK